MKECKIVIQDEVNCKVTNLDLTERKILMKMFEHEVPGARFLPSVRLGRWNGKTSFFSLGGSTYVNLLEQIIPVIDRAGYEIELEDLREVIHSFDFNEIIENTFAHKVWPNGHPMAGQPILFRDYQIEIVNNYLRNPQSIQEVATGAGKTLMTAALSYSIEKYGRSIVIVPNKSLVVQTEADYINLGLDVGVYFGDRKELGHTHTICTWQSLNHLIKTKEETESCMKIGEFMKDVVCVMVDECFGAACKVLTPTGYVPIKELKAGDKVINFSEKTKEFKVDNVIKQHKNLTKSSSEKMYKLEFDNGSIIEVTGNHKFLTNLGWVRADELTGSHEILTPNINTDD